MATGVRGTVVGSGGSGTNATALTIPATAVAGDVAYFGVVQGGGSAITPSFSSGNTWQQTAPFQAWNGTTSRLTIYKRILDATDPGTTCNVSFGVSQIWALGLIVVSGSDGTEVVSTATIKNTASTTDTFNNVTPSANDALQIYFDGNQLAASSATGITHTTPTGFSKLLDQTQAGTNNHTGLSIGTKQLVGQSGVAQSTGNITLNGSARQMALVIAVNPATAPSFTDSAETSAVPTDQTAGFKGASRTGTEAATPSDRAAGVKAATRPVADATTPADRSAGLKAAVAATSTLGVLNDAPVGARVQPNKPTTDSTAPADRPVGAKLAARSTTDGGTATDRPTGAKLAAKSSSDATTPADRPGAGSKLVARANADATTPTDQIVGIKRASGATSTASAQSSRPLGLKSVAGATVDSNPTNDSPIKVLARSGATSTAVAPRSVSVVRKTTAATSSDSTSPAERAPGAKSIVRSVTDSTTPSARPTGLKRAIRVVVEAVTPADRPAGLKRGIAASTSSCVPATWSVGSKLGRGAARSESVADDWAEQGPTFTRNISIFAGDVRTSGRPGALRSSAPTGILRRYALRGGRINPAPGGGVRGNP